MIRVLVHFEDGIALDVQGVALLDFERHLRRLTNLDVRVQKHLKTDDSKLRVMMTEAQRAKL